MAILGLAMKQLVDIGLTCESKSLDQARFGMEQQAFWVLKVPLIEHLPPLADLQRLSSAANIKLKSQGISRLVARAGWFGIQPKRGIDILGFEGI